MSAPRNVCECRFCGDTFGPDGITNHETFCDENPNSGVPVEKQKELGILPDEYTETGDEPGQTPRAAEPDPDQRAEAAADGGLPPRRSPTTDKSSRESGSSEESSTCPNCGSQDHIPAFRARKGFENELETPLPDELRATLDAVERYCNGCWHVWGGELDNPYPIMENPEGGEHA